MQTVKYDKQSDSLYFFLKKGEEAYFDEIQPNISVEYNEKDEPIGIEILNASTIIPKLMNGDTLYPTPGR